MMESRFQGVSKSVPPILQSVLLSWFQIGNDFCKTLEIRKGPSGFAGFRGKVKGMTSVPIRALTLIFCLRACCRKSGEDDGHWLVLMPRRTDNKKMAPKNEVFDYGTGVPYTHEDLEILFGGRVERRKGEPRCSTCRWFDASSGELCRGPVSCIKWVGCSKCCPLTGRATLVEFETCPQFQVDPIMCQ